MPASRSHLIALEVAAIGVPLLLVYMGRTMLASAPTVPTLAAPDMPVITPTAALAATQLSSEQAKAAEWVRQLPPKYSLESPLNHPVPDAPKVVKTPVKEPELLPPPPPKANPIEGLRLTAVLGNDDGRLAAINGKIYRVGEAVRKGLTLTAIDERNARITLTGDDGSIYQIKREIK